MTNRDKLMHFRSIAIALVLAVALTAAACGGREQSDTQAGSSRSSNYERVLASGVIRAGYLPYPPGSIKDPNTGKLSGVHIETLERAAAAIGLRVEWVEASGWGSIVEDIRSRRVDVIGSPVWANSTRGKLAGFTRPLFWSGICIFVRADDHRFDARPAGINDAAVRIATIDGEMSDIVAKADYPNAQRVSLPQNSDNSVMLENVVSGRADVVFVEPYIAQLYLRNHPNALRNITPTNPIRVFPNSMMVPIDDPAFLSMLNTAIDELANSGVVDQLLKKYVPEPGAFFPTARPYGTQ